MTRDANPGPVRRNWKLAACAAVLALLAACSQPAKTNGEIDVKPDIPRATEAQSDFLDIGKEAGLQWQSFVPRDAAEFPEYFEGLDADQKRRLRLGPKEDPDTRALFQFKLPAGAKVWAVDWYGTDLQAVDLEGLPGFSVALCKGGRDPAPVPDLLAQRRAAALGAKGRPATVKQESNRSLVHTGGKNLEACYGCAELRGHSGVWLLVAEWRHREGEAFAAPERVLKGLDSVLGGISVRRELALEGSPKHKCTSSLEDLLRGNLVFPGGTLHLPLKPGQLARKVGGDSTIQVDGQGAKPWFLLRRLKETEDAGGLRARLRADTTLSRRIGKAGAQFGAGQRMQKARLPIVVFDYADADADQQALGVIAVGTELLTLELVSSGLREGEARREAREAALALLRGANSLQVETHDLRALEGWNPGTMGRDD